MRTLIPIAAAAALLVAAPSQAATVKYSTDTDGDEGGYVESRLLSVTAAAGETNRMKVTVGLQEIVITDPGATFAVEPNTPCSVENPHTVRCAFAILGGGADPKREKLYAGVVAALGDGNDQLGYESSLPRDAEAGTQLRGEAGDDDITIARGTGTIYGGAGRDNLTGGPGPDLIGGGPDVDTLAGGDGDDLLWGDFDGVYGTPIVAVSADRIDGGSGGDTVDYLLYSAPVTVDLADPAPDGAAAESDVLTGIETVRGGDGDDVLTGDDEANTLEGGAGKDTANVLGVDDVISAETVDGGGENDLLRGSLRSYSCGAGVLDKVDVGALAQTKRPAPADCEYVEGHGALTWATPRMSSARRAEFRILGRIRARATLGVYLKSKRIGQVTYRFSAGTRRKVTVRLTRAVRKGTLLRVRLSTNRVRQQWVFKARSG